jgi:hypothetical protein
LRVKTLLMNFIPKKVNWFLNFHDFSVLQSNVFTIIFISLLILFPFQRD